MKQRHRKHRRPVRDKKASRIRALQRYLSNPPPRVIEEWSGALWHASRIGQDPKPA